jgi:hypothetical protein
VHFAKYYEGDQVKEDPMGRICSTRGSYEKLIRKFWSENLKGRDHLEDLGVDGRIILE